jgi:lysophospholipase L1-like esterase
LRRRSCLLLAGASLLAFPFVLEGIVRVRQWKRYGTTDASYYQFARDPATGLRIPRPGYRIGAISVNSLGFRGPEIEQPKPPERIRVAFLGASTTFCAEASAFETTWPHLVVEGLRRNAPDLEFDYVNGGAGGFTLADSLLNLEKRLAPLEPDVIVFYEATNDLTADTRRLALAEGLWEKQEKDHSRVGDFWLTFYLIEKNVLRFLRMRDEGEKLDFDADALARGYGERLARVVEAAQARCPVVALVTFSVQIRRDQPPERQRSAAASALFYMPFLDPVRLMDGYDAYNRALREVARARGAILIEGEETIPGDAEHFADTVHLRDPGLILQAERVLAGLEAAPAYRALVDARRAARAAASGRK